MNCLVIGLGSIGARHAAVLHGMGLRVHVVEIAATDRVTEYRYFGSVQEVLDKVEIEYVVIATPTSAHHQSLLDLLQLGYNGRVLVEKPLFDRMRPLPHLDFGNVFVGYNLRFHPVVREIRSISAGKKIFSISIYVGQYLPEWRPGTEYRNTYSALRKEGGGVLRDLSHELDYLAWLAGDWKRVAALGGKYSDLEVDSDDVYSLLLETERCPVAMVQMNYLDRKFRREVILNADGLTLKADLVRNVLEVNREIRTFTLAKDQTYLSEHEALLSGDTKDLCSLEQASAILRLIGCAEEACGSGKWIEN